MAYEAELQTACDAALKAGDVQMDMKKNLTGVMRKKDRSPVTDVDRLCESMLRDTLLGKFPQDGFLGEETGRYEGTSGRTWIVDPLDGTRPYIRGIPTHSVLIALEDGGEPVTGVMHLPAMRETYRARKGGGAYLNDTAIHVSTASDISQSMGSALGIIEKAGSSTAGCLAELMKACDYMYGFMDAYSYGCIAAGRLDLCVNLLDSPWDCAAAACVVSEAGGNYSDITGNRNIYNGSIVFTNGILHRTVLDFFNACRATAGTANEGGEA
jgi:histidinol phosphatase-like enzyme (inositol monophosphatase family)